MSGTHVAFIRGINVGRAKRVAMADLRALVENVGYRDARTVLNSGNVIFAAPTAVAARDAGAKIERAMKEQLGVSARVIVLPAEEVVTAVKDNPLAGIVSVPSRLMMAMFAKPSDRARLTSLTRQDWKPEALALGNRVIYAWCPGGILESPLYDAMDRVLRDAFTARNLATMTRIAALLEGG
jgi:uncharacterized protein (DUF1697 family)